MQNQWEPWACFPATRWSHLGVMGDSDTQNVLLMSSLLCNLVLVAVTAENLASQRQGVGKGSRLFSAFVATSGCSTLTLIRTYGDLQLSRTHFQGHHHLQSQAAVPLLALTRSIHLANSQMGIGSIPSQFRGLLSLGSHAQTLLKAQRGDHAPAGREKALAQCLSESLLMFDTCQTHVKHPRIHSSPPQFQFGFECGHFICWLEHSCRSPLKWQIEATAQVECVTAVSKFFDPFCDTEMCCQWWLFF